MKESIKNRVENHLTAISKLPGNTFEATDAIAQSIASCFLNGGRLYICGSGSAYNLARHTESLFVGHCKMERPPLPGIALHIDNYLCDGDQNEIFEKQLMAFLTTSDMIFALSPEPVPEMLIKALRYAGHMGVAAAGLSGKDQGKLHGLCDSLIAIDNNDWLTVIELHTVLIHIICHRVDEIMFSMDQ